MIVLDTNVVSELMRPAPAPAVLTWLGRERTDRRSTTAITVAEVRYGIRRLPDGARKDVLRRAADLIFADFPGQLLPFTATAAESYAEIVAHREHTGLPIGVLDAQIAAVCRVHGATLATRDVADFRGTGVDLVNPWEV